VTATRHGPGPQAARHKTALVPPGSWPVCWEPSQPARETQACPPPAAWGSGPWTRSRGGLTECTALRMATLGQQPLTLATVTRSTLSGAAGMPRKTRPLATESRPGSSGRVRRRGALHEAGSGWGFPALAPRGGGAHSRELPYWPIFPLSCGAPPTVTGLCCVSSCPVEPPGSPCPWLLLLRGRPADLYGQGDDGGASAKSKQPAGAVWYRGTTAVGVHLLSFLILPVAFLAGRGLSAWMEL